MATGKAIQLAENAEWEALLMLIEIDPSHVQDRDRFGMYVLHWLCTDDHVPLSILKSIHSAFPHALRAKNNSQMLPLHIAVQNKLPVPHIEFLVAQYPMAVDEVDEKGKTPLSMETKFSAFSKELGRLNVLRSASSEYLEDNINAKEENLNTDTANSVEDHSPSLQFQSQLPSLRDEMKKIRLLLEEQEKDRKKRNARKGLALSHYHSNDKAPNAIRCDDNQTFHQIEHQESVEGESIYEVVWQKGDLGMTLAAETSSINPAAGSNTVSSSDNSSDAAKSAGAKVSQVSEVAPQRRNSFFRKGKNKGLELVSVGDILTSINGLNVQETPFRTIILTLKNSHKNRHNPMRLRFKKQYSSSDEKYKSGGRHRKSSTTTVASSYTASELASSFMTQGGLDEQNLLVRPDDSRNDNDNQTEDSEEEDDAISAMQTRLLLLLSDTIARCEELESETIL